MSQRHIQQEKTWPRWQGATSWRSLEKDSGRVNDLVQLPTLTGWRFRNVLEVFIVQSLIVPPVANPQPSTNIISPHPLISPLYLNNKTIQERTLMVRLWNLWNPIETSKTAQASQIGADPWLPRCGFSLKGSRITL